MDQAVSSATNFALTFIALGALSSDDYAIFSTAVVVSLGTVAILRSYIIEPVIISAKAAADIEWRGAISVMIRVASTIALTGSLATVLIGEGMKTASVAALSVPLLGLFELARYRCFARGRLGTAILLDGSWLLVSVGAAILSTSIRQSALLLFAAWVVPPGVLGAVALARLINVSERTARRQWRVERALPLVVDTVLESATLWMVLATAWVLSGSDLVAAVNATRLLFGPLTIMVLALPAFYAKRRVHVGRGGGAGLLWTAPVLAVVVLGAVGLTFYLSLTELSARIAGETWSRLDGLLLPLGIFTIASALQQVGRHQIRYFGAPADLRAPRAATIALLLLLPVGFARGASAEAMNMRLSIGLAFGAAFGCLLWLSRGRRVLNP